VVTYERSLAGRGFSLADSGLYQDVVEEGCEAEHGGKEWQELQNNEVCMLRHLTERFFGLIFS
jgi:hypothetical protein